MRSELFICVGGAGIPDGLWQEKAKKDSRGIAFLLF